MHTCAEVGKNTYLSNYHISFSAGTSFVVVSMYNVIRGFGMTRAKIDEAMTPIAGAGNFFKITSFNMYRSTIVLKHSEVLF